jgi:hypothetical protein
MPSAVPLMESRLRIPELRPYLSHGRASRATLGHRRSRHLGRRRRVESDRPRMAQGVQQLHHDGMPGLSRAGPVHLHKFRDRNAPESAVSRSSAEHDLDTDNARVHAHTVGVCLLTPRPCSTA